MTKKRNHQMPEGTVSLTLRIPPSLHDAVEREAGSRELSINEFCKRVLSNRIKRIHDSGQPDHPGKDPQAGT